MSEQTANNENEISDNVTEADVTSNQNVEPITFDYIEIIEEENAERASQGKQPVELPDEIAQKIKALKPQIAKYNSTGNENLKKALIKQDTEISDLIIDFFEKELPSLDEFNAKEAERLAEEERIAKEKADAEEAERLAKEEEERLAKEKAAQEEAERLAAEAEANRLSPEQEQLKSILDIINADKEGMIATDDLKHILGRLPKDPYEIVCNYRFRKVFWRPKYAIDRISE